MARTLPWLVSSSSSQRAANQANSRSGTAHRARAVKRKRASTKQSDTDEDGVTTGNHKKQSSRTPSTSPPPPPPSHESMKADGTDDVWVMVEDEFYTTAQSFTQHLHHAEYKRLKHEASKKTVEAIVSIERPVDGRTKMSKEMKVGKTQELKRKNARTALASREEINRMSKDVEDDSEDMEVTDENVDGDGVVINDKNLAGLMMGSGTSAKKKRTNLTDLIERPKTHTRAAAGFKKRGAGEIQRVNPDLSLLSNDTWPTSPTPEATRKPPEHATKSSTDRAIDRDHDRWNRTRNPQPEPQPTSPSKTLPSRNRDVVSNFNDYPARQSSSSVKIKAERKRDGDFNFDDFPSRKTPISPRIKTEKKVTRPDEQKAKSKLDEIPTFLV